MPVIPQYLVKGMGPLSYAISEQRPCLLPTSDGDNVNLSNDDLFLILSGRGLGVLVDELGSSATTNNHLHDFDAFSILNFLDHHSPRSTLPAKQPLTTYDSKPYQPPADMRGLKCDHLHVRWEAVDPDMNPEELACTPVYSPKDPIEDASLTFGSAIIGDNKLFERAVLLTVVLIVGDQSYVACATNRIARPVCLVMYTRLLASLFPGLFSPHAQLAALIAPELVGMTRAGSYTIREKLSFLYRTPKGYSGLRPQIDLSYLPGIREGVAEPSQTFPMLHNPTGLGDWVKAHRIPRDILTNIDSVIVAQSSRRQWPPQSSSSTSGSTPRASMINSDTFTLMAPSPKREETKARISDSWFLQDEGNTSTINEEERHVRESLTLVREKVMRAAATAASIDKVVEAPCLCQKIQRLWKRCTSRGAGHEGAVSSEL
ncbi:hypothetical protein AAF712_014699 [Marasmius tenuissimus]|uniref:Uncharacterized protein n=1 Tax=Marasmius tenuissimus TaxID=585030 RepID=A0ABR2ZBF4_9AGAR